MAWTGLIALATVLIVVSVTHPCVLSNSNSFFAAFVNHELLAFLGVVVTITLASAASLHLEFNKIEERSGETMREARVAVGRSAFALIIIFAAAIPLVIAKPFVLGFPIAESLLHSVVVLMLVINIAILADLTMAVFKIPPARK